MYNTASVKACNEVDEVVTSNDPNCGITFVGANTGWMVAPSSITP
jgi:hypothetical protein